jgi:hypothetical protein
VSLGIKMGDLRCYPFLNPHKKKIQRNQKIVRRKQKNISMKIEHKDAQKMTKDWLRKFKTTKIEI